MSDPAPSSLVACLRFAAALVPATVTPADICTKATLGAIVIESHRLAQHATAMLSSSDTTDPRRLLSTLSRLDEQLTRMSFCDVTWDFEGAVAQTLEMELQDVEERAAATLAANVCVLLTAYPSSQHGNTKTPETAVLWFPRANDRSNNSRKYLLFVAPGRVKVVKSLSELMKRLHEEMVAVRAPHATYRVWTLTAQQQKTAKSTKATADILRVTMPQEQPEDGGGVQATTHTIDDVVPHVDADIQTPLDNEKANVPRGSLAGPDPSHAKLLTIRIADKKQHETSIFSFPLETTSTLIPPPTVSTPVACRAPSMERPPEEAPPPDAPPHEPRARVQCLLRPVSKSFASLETSTTSPCSNAVWQSTDGRVKRPPLPREESMQTRSIQDDNNTIYPPNTANTQEDNSDVSTTTAPVPARCRVLRVPPRTVTETVFQFSATARVQSPAKSPLHHSVTSHSPVMTPHAPAMPTSTQDNTTRLTPGKALGTDDLSQVHAKTKKRSARDHYRAKLGARGWWELEYQATKLLEQSAKGLSHRDGQAAPSMPRRTQPIIEKTRMESPTSDESMTRSDAEPRTHHEQVRVDLQSSLGPTEATLETMNRSSMSSRSMHENTSVSSRGTDPVPVETLQQVQTHHQDERASTTKREPNRMDTVALSYTNPEVTRPAWYDEQDAPYQSNARVYPATESARMRSSKLLVDTSVVVNPVSAPSVSQPVVHREAPRFTPMSSRHLHGQDPGHEENDTVLMTTLGPAPIQRTGTKQRSPPDDDDSHAVCIEPAEVQVHRAMARRATERVPIRQPRSDAQRVAIRISTLSDDEGDEDALVRSPSQPPPLTKEEPATTRTKGVAHHHPIQPAATFVAIDPTVDDASKRAREAKLAELRRRKLQALQKARDESMLKKKPVRVVARPLTDTAPPPQEPVSVPVSTAATAISSRTRKATNRQLIQNAIEYTLLAGGSLERERQAALQALAESPCDNFIVLLKSAKELKFRALYEHHVDRGRILKLFAMASSAPPALTDDVIGQYFRYNSGKKEFAAIDSRAFTVKTDACAMTDHMVFKKKPLARVLL